MKGKSIRLFLATAASLTLSAQTAPVLDTPVVNGNSITVNWPPVQDAQDGYLIDVSTSPAFSIVTTLHQAPGSSANGTLNGWSRSSGSTAYIELRLGTQKETISPSIDLTGVTNAKLSFDARTYGGTTPVGVNLIRVEASTDGGLNYSTLVDECTPADTTLRPQPPMSLNAVCGNVIKLKISAPNSTTGVGVGVNNILITTVEPNLFDNLPLTDGDLPYTFNNLAYETTYYFRARSVDGVSTSGFSVVKSATTGIELQPPAAPVLSAAITGVGEITVSWPSVSLATNTLFYASDDSSFTTCLIGFDGVLTNSPVVLSGLALGTYYFRAVSLGEAGNSAFSATVSLEMIELIPGEFGIFWDFEDLPRETPEVTGNIGFFTVTDITPQTISALASTDNTTYAIAITASDTSPVFNAATANYITWKVVPTSPDFVMTITNFSFRNRSTASGPKSWRLVAECDGIPVTLGVGENAMPSDSGWHTFGAQPYVTLSSENPIVFKLYGYYCAASGVNNWRVDDILLQGALMEVNPPLVPPVLRAAGITASSITVEWDAVKMASEGYLFDASRFPDFKENLRLDNCMMTTYDLNEWTMTPSLAYSLSGGALLFTNALLSNLYLPNQNPSVLTSTPIDLVGIPNAKLTFNAQTFGGVLANANRIRVRVNSSSLSDTLYFTPTNNTLSANAATFDLAAFENKIITLTFDVPESYWVSASNYRGAGINNIKVEAVIGSYITPCKNYATSDTSVTVNDLAPNTTYYFRARSVGDDNEITDYSAVLPVKTLDDTLDPVVLRNVENLTYNSATLCWESHLDATGGYHVELYKPAATADVAGPSVVITKVIYRSSGSNKALELTNIGRQPADLAQYNLRRMRLSGSTVDDNWNFTLNLSNCTTANGGSLTLAAGESILLVYTEANHSLLTGAKSLRSGATGINWSNNNLLGLFQGNTLRDTARTVDNSVESRSPVIAAGRASVLPSEWTSTPYTGAGSLTAAVLSPHICYVPVFPTASTSATGYNLANLRPRITYIYRVRAIGSTSYSPWSAASFLTPEPPKNTVFTVR